MPTGSIAEALVRFRADASGLKGDVDKLKGEARRAGEDAAKTFGAGFKRGTDQAGEALEHLGERAGRLTGIITNPFVLGAAAAGGLALGVRASIQSMLAFEQQFQRVEIALQGTAVSSKEVRQELLAMPAALGDSIELTKAYNTVIRETAGASKEAQLEVARVAGQFAILADTTPQKAAGLLVDVMDAFSLSAERAGDVAAKLFEITRKGGGDFEELNAGFRVLAPNAANLGLNIDELLASIQVLGEAGIPAQRGLAALNVVFPTLSANLDRFTERGINLRQSIREGGLLGALRSLQEFTGGSENRLREMGFSGRMASTVTALMKVSVDQLNKSLAELGATGVGHLRLMFVESQKNPVQQVRQLTAEWEKFKTVVGGTFEVPLTDTVKAIREGLELARANWLALRKAMSEGVSVKQLMEFVAGKPRPDDETLKLLSPFFAGTAGKAFAGFPAPDPGDVKAIAYLAAHTKQAAAAQKDYGDAVTRTYRRPAPPDPGTIARERQLLDLQIAGVHAQQELKARGAERFAEQTELAKQAVQGELEIAGAMRDTNRAIEQRRAEFEGRAVSGEDTYYAARRKQIQETADLEITTAQLVASAQKSALRARLADVENQIAQVSKIPGAGKLDAQGKPSNPELEKQLIGLREQRAQVTEAISQTEVRAQARITKANQDATKSAAQLFEQEDQDRQRNNEKAVHDADALFQFRRQTGQASLRDELDYNLAASNDYRRSASEKMSIAAKLYEFLRAARDSVFKAEVAIGRRSIQEERERLNATAADESRSVDERVSATVDLFNLEKRLAEDRLDFRKSLNLAALQDEIEFWASAARAAEAGSQVQMDAVKRVTGLIRQQRDEARGAAQDALSIARARREERENPNVNARFTSRAQIERENQRQREEDRETLERERAGQRVREDKLEGALRRQAQFEAIDKAGGVAGAFRAATKSLPQLFMEQMQQVPQVVNTELGKVVEGFQSAFASIRAMLDAAFAQVKGKPAAQPELSEEERQTRRVEQAASLGGGTQDLQQRALAIGDVDLARQLAAQDTAAATRKVGLIDMMTGGGEGPGSTIDLISRQAREARSSGVFGPEHHGPFMQRPEPLLGPIPDATELVTGSGAMAPMMDQGSGRWVEGMLSGLDQVEAKIRTLGDALEDVFTRDNAPWVRSLADRVEEILAEQLEQNR